MNSNKIDYTQVDLTPYEFDKKVVEESEVSVFNIDEKGNITGLNHQNFALAAAILMQKLQGK